MDVLRAGSPLASSPDIAQSIAHSSGVWGCQPHSCRPVRTVAFTLIPLFWNLELFMQSSAAFARVRMSLPGSPSMSPPVV